MTLLAMASVMIWMRCKGELAAEARVKSMKDVKHAPSEWLVVDKELKNGLPCVTLQHLIEPVFMVELAARKAEFVSGVSDEVLRLPERVQSRWKEIAMAQFERGLS